MNNGKISSYKKFRDNFTINVKTNNREATISPKAFHNNNSNKADIILLPSINIGRK